MSNSDSNIRLTYFLLVLLLNLTAFSSTNFARSFSELRMAINQEKNDSLKAHLYLELAQQGELEASAQQEALNEALKLSILKPGNYLHALCLLSMANFYINTKGDYNQALQLILQSLKICERKNLVNLKGKVYIGLAGLYLKRDNFPLAEKYYLLGLEIKEREGNQNELGNAYNNIGNFYNDNSNYDKALDFYQKSLSIRQIQKDTLSIAVCYDNIANVYASIGSSTKNFSDYLKAEEFYRKALSYFSILGDKLELAICYINLSEFYFEKAQFFKQPKDIARAIELGENGLLLSNQIGFREGMAAAYGNLSQVNEYNGKYRESLRLYKLFKSTNDSINNLESAKHIAELQTAYDVEKKDQQIKFQDAEINKQKIVRNSFISGFILVLFFSFFIYLSYREKKKVNLQLSQAKLVIEEKNKSITDSINYAQRIQNAILPTKNGLLQLVPESFVLYKPKDIVSGDFYWFHQLGRIEQDVQKEYIVIACADCTGHGVPGAFMSVIGTNLLGEIVGGKGIYKPSLILSHLNANVRNALKQNDKGSATNDGMDMALCTINKSDSFLEFSGANRPLYMIHRKEGSIILDEIKASKFPVGGSQFTKDTVNYINHKVPYSRGDSFYLFSDGYCDQFGGENDKKFMSKKFRELLISIQHLTMQEQESMLNQTIENWKGSQEQSDDILIIGFRL